MSRLRASHFIFPDSLIKGGTGRRTAPLKRIIGKLYFAAVIVYRCASARAQFIADCLPTKKGKKVYHQSQQKWMELSEAAAITLKWPLSPMVRI